MTPYYLLVFIWICLSVGRASAEPAWGQASLAEGAVLRLRSASVTQPPPDSVVPEGLRKASPSPSPSPSPSRQGVRQGSVVDSVEVSIIRLVGSVSLSKEAVSELSQITDASNFKSDVADNTSGFSSGTLVLIPDSKESDLAWVIECLGRAVRVRLAVSAGAGIWQFTMDGKSTGIKACQHIQAVLEQRPAK
jgi:hypothetical protein